MPWVAGVAAFIVVWVSLSTPYPRVPFPEPREYYELFIYAGLIWVFWGGYMVVGATHAVKWNPPKKPKDEPTRRQWKTVMEEIETLKSIGLAISTAEIDTVNEVKILRARAERLQKEIDEVAGTLSDLAGCVEETDVANVEAFRSIHARIDNAKPQHPGARPGIGTWAEAVADTFPMFCQGDIVQCVREFHEGKDPLNLGQTYVVQEVLEPSGNLPLRIVVNGSKAAWAASRFKVGGGLIDATA